MEPPREQLLTLLNHPSHALTEDDLLPLWKYLCPRIDGLRTARGETVRVVEEGEVGHPVGPDVTGATIELSGIRRRGDVEVHRQTAGWYRHGHHRDSGFNTVVLHVVLTGTKEPVRRRDDHWVDTLVLEPYLDEVRERLRDDLGTSVRERRRRVKRPCYREDPDADAIGETLERVGETWLTKRAGAFRNGERGDPVRALIGALGYTRNHEAFDRLARRLAPDRFRDALTDAESTDSVEGYLLGIGGWLEELPTGCNRTLLRRRRAWRTRWPDQESLVDAEAWIRSGVRPQAWPVRRWICFGWATRRIVGEHGSWERWLGSCLAESLREADKPAPLSPQLDPFFEFPPNNYWRRHYSRTDDGRGEVPRPVGRTWFTQVGVNVLLPYLYYRSVKDAEPSLLNAVKRTVRAIPPVLSNRRTRRVQRQWGFEDEDFPWGNALRQQGAIHLYKNGCVADNCSRCPLNVDETARNRTLFEPRR